MEFCKQEYWSVLPFPSPEDFPDPGIKPWSNSWVRKICWRRDRLPISVFLGFPGGSAGKDSACNAGDLGSIPRLGRSPGEEKGYPLQRSGLVNSMDYIVHGVTKSRMWLRDFHFQFQSCPASFPLSLLPFVSHTTMVTLSFFLFSEHGIFLSLKQQQKKLVSNLSELHPPLLKSE